MQELVEGKSLAQMVEAGWRPNQKEVERIAKDLLTTFSYLQGQKVHLSSVAIADWRHSLFAPGLLQLTLHSLPCKQYATLSIPDHK